ncbi:hypothetical protein [Pseudonocardia oroxyli]|uniref:Uncharacterized protein n=1 Tax=Pseudonocardia oroxyli TaxID=366584 RepID=A0A1G7YKQ0_PSEOR|nr:hypothetical protein [Pseudonocardia oroxyli]SDG96875.1 hypothetical protein SAMN05216377_11781 [Pseudonocardia oroxyli]
MTVDSIVFILAVLAAFLGGVVIGILIERLVPVTPTASRGRRRKPRNGNGGPFVSG